MGGNNPAMHALQLEALVLHLLLQQLVLGGLRYHRRPAAAAVAPLVVPQQGGEHDDRAGPSRPSGGSRT